MWDVDLKHATTALLLLNQRRALASENCPATHRLQRGKRVVYAAHSVVRLSLDVAADIRRTFKVDDRASPRRHEVRGHFVHFDLDETCSHDWADHDLGDGRRRWRCRSCDARRTWRDGFSRGDASVGFVTKEYAVTSNVEG